MTNFLAQAVLSDGLSLYPASPAGVLSGGHSVAAPQKQAAPGKYNPGAVSPAASDLAVNPVGDLVRVPFSDYSVYSGTDLRVLIEPDVKSELRQPPRQMIELTTLTVSVHREKAPVRACGYINPKGFARGRRTIAGTLVLTQFNIDVLYRFLNFIQSDDYSRDSFYTKPDQLPRFNMLLVFANEFGFVSWRRLMGIELLTDGTVYSTHDLYAEQTITYMASDFTPLLPMSEPAVLPTTPQYEATPKSVIGIVETESRAV